jgi:hypothetical protein
MPLIFTFLAGDAKEVSTGTLITHMKRELLTL